MSPWPRYFLSRKALEKTYARPRSRFDTVRGVRLHALDEGPADGPVVVTLPAQWTGFSQWDDWAPLMTDRYRVIRLDLPGHGLSDRMDMNDYSIDAYVRLLAAWADQIGLDRFFLVGTSFSGAVAFKYAAQAGDRLRGLILANASGMPRGAPPPNPPPPGLILPLIWKHVRPPAFIRWKLGQVIQDQSRITPARLREYTEMNNARGRIREAAARMRDYRSGDPLPILAEITAPTLVQWATHTTYLPTVEADKFVAALVKARPRKIIYPGVGHLIIEDAPVATGRDARAIYDACLDAEA